MRRPILLLLLASFGLAATAGAALAGEISLGVNETRHISLSGTAANVVIADAKVADVSMLDAHSIIVTGHSYGATGLLITDHAGRTLLDSQVVVSTPNRGHITYYAGHSLVMDYTCGVRCQYMTVTTTSPSGQ